MAADARVSPPHPKLSAASFYGGLMLKLRRKILLSSIGSGLVVIGFISIMSILTLNSDSNIFSSFIPQNSNSIQETKLMQLPEGSILITSLSPSLFFSNHSSSWKELKEKHNFANITMANSPRFETTNSININNAPLYYYIKTK